MKLLLLIFVFHLARYSQVVASAKNSDKVESSLYNALKIKSSVNILVSFRSPDKTEVLNPVSSQSLSSSPHNVSTVQALYDSLKNSADQVQKQALKLFKKPISSPSRYEVKQLWITNQLFVKNADKELVDRLAIIVDVIYISEEKFIAFENPIRNISNNINGKKIFSPFSSSKKSFYQWGIERIQAPQVWSTGVKGAGVVVANIDSGVRGTHEALREGFRREYGWFDAIDGTTSPFDDNGHGTHTMGTIVGRKNGIGVAPEARWIACRACNHYGCFRETLIQCCQWILCPTDVYGNNPKCNLAPNIVSNSWGLLRDEEFFQKIREIIEDWNKAGISSFFSSGNDGPTCGTVNPLATSKSSMLVVGASDSDDRVLHMSSAGPAVDGSAKPDFVAPGSNVLSAGHLSDSDYTILSGSSQACPHAAGVAALLYSKNPGLSPIQVKDALIAGTELTAETTRRDSCGSSQKTFPNNLVGWGRVSASSSLRYLSNF